MPTRGNIRPLTVKQSKACPSVRFNYFIMTPDSVTESGTSLSRVSSGYGASLGWPVCDTSKMYVQQVRLTIHESETAQKEQTT
jgi:hypothetical protein